MIARHVGQHGYVCPGDGPEHPAHPTRDLTLDHVVALIEGGAPFDPANTRVLCRSRNSANGARLVNARRLDQKYHTRVLPSWKTAPSLCVHAAEFRE
jgi:5-methylcytosine-specific restriction endonuclease McrA